LRQREHFRHFPMCVYMDQISWNLRMPPTKEERGLPIIDTVAGFRHEEMRKHFLWHRKAAQQTAAPNASLRGFTLYCPVNR